VLCCDGAGRKKHANAEEREYLACQQQMDEQLHDRYCQVERVISKCLSQFSPLLLLHQYYCSFFMHTLYAQLCMHTFAKNNPLFSALVLPAWLAK